MGLIVDSLPATKMPKPCPFCGSPYMQIHVTGKGYEVYCLGCRARSPISHTAELAVLAWNRRTKNEN